MKPRKLVVLAAAVGLVLGPGTAAAAETGTDQKTSLARSCWADATLARTQGYIHASGVLQCNTRADNIAADLVLLRKSWSGWQQLRRQDLWEQDVHEVVGYRYYDCTGTGESTYRAVMGGFGIWSDGETKTARNTDTETWRCPG